MMGRYFITTCYTVLVLMALLYSCSRHNSNSNDTGKDKSEVFLEFQRTACFGACPIYQVIVKSNGEATYNGIRFVDRLGEYTATAGDQFFNAVKTEAERINFFSLNAEYPPKDQYPTDLPNTVTTLSYGGQSHRVINHNYNPPGDLEQFEKNIDSLINLLPWKPVLEKD